jgi:DNA-binding NtrC family response regulator
MQHVLIAEGNAGLRNLLASVLAAAGYTVTMAEDGAEALEAAGRFRSPIDLLCANMTVACVNGASLAERLKERNPEMKVVLMITENPRMVAVDMDQADRHPDYTVVRKPFTLDEFAAKVRQILPPAAA